MCDGCFAVSVSVRVGCDGAPTRVSSDDNGIHQGGCVVPTRVVMVRPPELVVTNVFAGVGYDGVSTRVGCCGVFRWNWL